MNTIVRGAIAGAAGTMALDVASYTDMAVRGRASSTMPAETVRRLLQRAGITALSTPIDRAPAPVKHRQTALGALSGYAVGIGIGTMYGATRSLGATLPVAIAGIALGALAMLASDAPAAAVKAIDLRTWGTSGWLADAIPHAIYGLVTASVFEAIMGGNARG